MNRSRRRGWPAWILVAAGGLVSLRPAAALNPSKALTQYSRTIWTQEQGLPQDTIRAITQTADGYLWLGTDEGLARFDGYEFVVYDKNSGNLPANSITALTPAADGALWIGTASGLTCYRKGKFHTYTTRDGLPDNGVTALFEDRAGALWIVAGVYLSRFQSGRFTNFSPGKDMPITAARAVCEDRRGVLWVAGFGGVARRENGKFIPVLGGSVLGTNIVISLLVDHRGNLCIAGSKGLLVYSPDGRITRYGTRQGLVDPFIRALWEDRDGNLWAGTNGGLSRLVRDRFMTPILDGNRDRDWVRCIFEDREGNLWVGMNNGLNRFRDDVFTIYSKAEGLPSDEPTAVFQDRSGSIWVGFHDAGLLRFGPGRRVFDTDSGLSSNEIFSIREARNGDLLVSTREGFSRLHAGRFHNFSTADPLGRSIVFDAFEDSRGRLWLATPSGLQELAGNRSHNVVPGGSLLNTSVVVIAEDRDHAIWAGTYGNGLWRVRNGAVRRFSTADGLSSDQIRALELDRDGTVWVGTFGGGLDAIRGGRFIAYTSRDGLLSDNISHIEDDGQSLWLSTTRGICRVGKRQLQDLTAGRVSALTPTNYGVEDGLRSAQCAPGYPTSGGGERTADGRLWFPTGRGLAVLDPKVSRPAILAPMVEFVEFTSEGRPVDFSRPARLAPGGGRIQIRYTGIHLSAPERVRYSYKLEGLDSEWVPAGSRRVINYNSLGHGNYRFIVRAEVPGGPAGETAYSFKLLPYFYETLWFRLLCAVFFVAVIWAAYRLRLQQIRIRFAAVLQERARMAREIHDTLAQGFVGISSQLDAVALCMPPDASPARQYLELARRMARHSLTEARRSVMDLRASALEGQDLAAALKSGTRMWTAGSNMEVEVEVTGEPAGLPQEVEQHLLRIAQEAVTNVLKHAAAKRVWVRLHAEARKLYLRITDDGRGFEKSDVFSSAGGHFGLIGMRERAERLGGELRLASEPGHGTQIEVTVPLP